MKREDYDIIVVGGGHAGIEAALAGARMGFRTLLISMLVEQTGAASCNPAIGGLAKGHLVRELDALGGEMGLLTDAAGIQFRILNEAKGPAVRGSRAQIDMDRYRVLARNTLLHVSNLEMLQETVEALILEGGAAVGVRTALLNEYRAKRVILTTGTFLRGVVHVGEVTQEAGRFGEFAAKNLSQSLIDAGLHVGRLKTGTCPRVDSSSIDFSVMEVQGGDAIPSPFSFRTDRERFAREKQQIPCYITYTNDETHRIIEGNFYRAPLFTGQIEGIGPRYCPSIEDKINRFRDKERHHLFIEPQTFENTECYINGMSTSLPPDVQRSMIRSVRGMENARIVRYGYAIEYDYVDPTELRHTLETKKVANLYLAGQINGTTGYEEAAAQGLMAGINAALSLQGKEPLILRRDEAYIGVLIDDLVTKGTKEPYRMFTSRAEYRLLLREESADLRLSHYGYELGLIDAEQMERVEAKRAAIAHGVALSRESLFTPGKAFLDFLESIGEEKINDVQSAEQIMSRKSFTIEKLPLLLPDLAVYDAYIQDQILTEAKYARYVEKQHEEIEKMKNLLHVSIPQGFDFASISGLSKEIVEKLQRFNPPTLQAASQISGITPAAISILHIYIKMGARG
ncbi:MAG: tRNA uridine-5-carboxymethylaminomethyl(34) synthesis enzyme MnmG [Campylobacterales bacterium]|nr:tRNA uridine-5-carboxymethylaminomethyl(34) synthesis enzyme MnmG [Campylobacterales bacterium]